jgi:hypothetical protein
VIIKKRIPTTDAPTRKNHLLPFSKFFLKKNQDRETGIMMTEMCNWNYDDRNVCEFVKRKQVSEYRVTQPLDQSLSTSP